MDKSSVEHSTWFVANVRRTTEWWNVLSPENLYISTLEWKCTDSPDRGPDQAPPSDAALDTTSTSSCCHSLRRVWIRIRCSHAPQTCDTRRRSSVPSGVCGEQNVNDFIIIVELHFFEYHTPHNMYYIIYCYYMMCLKIISWFAHKAIIAIILNLLWAKRFHYLKVQTQLPASI